MEIGCFKEHRYPILFPHGKERPSGVEGFLLSKIESYFRHEQALHFEWVMIAIIMLALYFMITILLPRLFLSITFLFYVRN